MRSITDSKSFSPSNIGVDDMDGPDITISLSASTDSQNLTFKDDDDDIKFRPTGEDEIKVMQKISDISATCSVASNSSKESKSTSSSKKNGPRAPFHPPYPNGHPPSHGPSSYPLPPYRNSGYPPPGPPPPNHYPPNNSFYGGPNSSAPYPGPPGPSGSFEQRYNGPPAPYNGPSPHYHPNMHQQPPGPGYHSQGPNYNRSYPPHNAYPPPSSFNGSHNISADSTYSHNHTVGKNSSDAGHPPHLRAPSASGSVTSSGSSRKKRTIDGMMEDSDKDGFTVLRSNSNSSTCSNATPADNASDTINNLTCDSPMKRERINRLPPCDSSIDRPRNLHKRSNSYSSSASASSLSFGGLSMGSYDKSRSKSPTLEDEGRPVQNHKRRKGQSVDENVPPQRDSDLGKTPVSKNTTSDATVSDRKSRFNFENSGLEPDDMKNHGPAEPYPRRLNSSFDTAGGKSGFSAESEVHTEEQSLNRHLRGQSFTPLPDVTVTKKHGNARNKTNSPSFNSDQLEIAPQLSWSISGDPPALGDLDNWGNDDSSKKDAKDISPSSLGGGNISPIFFKMDNVKKEKVGKKRSSGLDENILRLDALSPNSMDGDILGGKTTPLPFFEQRNLGGNDEMSKKQDNQGLTSPEMIEKMQYAKSNEGHHPIPNNDRSQQMNLAPSPANIHSLSSPFMHQNNPTTPHSAKRAMPYERRGEIDHLFRSGGPGRRDGPPPDYQSPRGMYGGYHGHRPANNQDRVRNLRGRGNHAPPPLHLPPHLPSHQHFLTSPIGAGGMSRNMMGLGSPHHLPPHAFQRSPHHMSASKRKCVPLKTPIPSKFQGDMEKMKNAQVPEFTSLVNFPSHMSQKQAHNLPDGMRCCVMCGHACPASAANKNKNKGKKGSNNDKNGSSASSAITNHNGSYAIIPTQNKGLCTLCDVNVWVVTTSMLEIKWCKGCKNFRPWAAFGDKGLATKCVRCRERQREKYAAQKQEKERTKALARKNGTTKVR